MLPESKTNVHRMIAGLADGSPSLELGTLDLCFLALLKHQAQQEGLTAFQEVQLADAFELVCGVLEPSAEQLRVRATHAISRLRKQSLLSRVDGAGVMRAGLFSLTRLAEGIVEFFLEEETLTVESLTVLTKTLSVVLAAILMSARDADTDRVWQDEVVLALDVTIGDLVDGIERRQRGLDLQQERFQQEIATLLKADWFGSVDQCQDLLHTSATTLRELNAMLLRETHPIQAQLQELLQLALSAEVKSAQLSVARVVDQVDRIAAWGAARQLAWSEYYEYVHRYLRDVVRLDPARALSQRLRDQLSASGRSFSLTIASAPPLRVLRAVQTVAEPPPVRRPRGDREKPLDEAKSTPDPMEELELAVKAELDLGVTSLAELTERLTAELLPEEKFIQAGRIAQVLSQMRRPLALRERPWLAVADNLAIEEWEVAVDAKERA